MHVLEWEGSVPSASSSVLHGRKDLTLSSNAFFTQSSTLPQKVSETDLRLFCSTHQPFINIFPVRSAASNQLVNAPSLTTEVKLSPVLVQPSGIAPRPESGDSVYLLMVFLF